MHDEPRLLPGPPATILPLALHVSHTGFPAVPHTCRVLSTLRAFAFAVPPAWEIHPLPRYITQFLTFFKCHFTREDFPEKPPFTWHPLAHFLLQSLLSFSIAYQMIRQHTVCIEFLLSVPLLLECKLYESRDFVCSLINP